MISNSKQDQGDSMRSRIRGSKYLWNIPNDDRSRTLSIASTYNLSIPIAQTLVTRGIIEKEQIDAYLFSSFERDVAHPSLMKDAEKAVERILQALEKQEKILVFGDYDVDGITSSSLMLICLLPLEAQVNFFLPNRVKDGYGLSVKAVERAAQNGYKLIITVDNGITAIDPVKRANELGIDVIITDHHRPHDAVPDAYAVVNPNQVDCPYPFKVLAGVGVTFKLLSLLYEKKGMTMPSKAYELLLLGTVADVVPLHGENRYWVRHGLQYVNNVESLALRVLKANVNFTKSEMSSTDIGFSIAPQLNALGRLEDPRRGVKFLIGSDVEETEQVGKVLFELNQARKEIERSIFMDVEAQILEKKIDITKENVIIAASDSWPPGVIGLVASRLVGTYGKPTILLHITKGGIAKGSCRSIPEFNLFNALSAAGHLLEQFGGHSLAAGLSLKLENVAALKAVLEQQVAEQLTSEDLTLKLSLDAELNLSDISKKFMTDMSFLQPFGNENAEPVFYVKNVVLVQKPQLLKDEHVKCSIFADGVVKPVIFFKRPELFELFNQQGEEPFDLAAKISENHWNGKVSLELMGLDASFRK
jgi:single-stranded-DNA-specific exonuclease